MPKVSVIVPIYNSEKTLVRCLSNLVHQTLEDIEIILVNDYSSDNSYKILLDCEKTYPEKVVVINLDNNLGAGGARNVGLMYATGEYIGFVDSDDMVDVTMYEKLYRIAVEGNYDIVDSGFIKESENKAIILTTDNCIGELDAWKKSKLISDMGYLVTKIFKHELWEGLRFREHAILEDMETIIYLFAKSTRIGNVKEILYKYCDNANSLSKEMDPLKYHTAIKDAVYAIQEVVMNLTEYSDIKEAVEYIVYNVCKSAMVMAKKYGIEMNISELKCIRRNLITINPYNNRFIRERIPKKEIDWMESMSK